jgi:hypothetical protein
MKNIYRVEFALVNAIEVQIVIARDIEAVRDWAEESARIRNARVSSIKYISAAKEVA